MTARVTHEERALLADAVKRARADGDRDTGAGIFKAMVKDHRGYSDIPGIESLVPDDGGVDVAVATEPAIEFDMAITENDLSGITIEATTPVTGIVPALVGRTITIAHDAFAGSEVHTVIIPADSVRNAIGLGNREIRWRFTTAS